MSKCTHQNLYKISDKEERFICPDCSKWCKSCESCAVILTEKTINKYNGVCGICFKQSDDEMDDTLPDEDEDMANEINKILFNFPRNMLFLMSGANNGTNLFDNNADFKERDIDSDCENEKPVKIKNNTVFSPSGIHLDATTMPTTESGYYIANSILLEDSNAKKYLVEWKNDNTASWESFNDIKKSKVFLEYKKRKK